MGIEHETEQGTTSDAAEQDHEREQVEQVFGLTGGELESKPWEPTADGEGQCFRYWYDGAPEYDEERARAHLIGDAQYRTVVDDCLCSSPEKELRESGCRWVLDARYSNSGECECPGAGDEDDDREGDCPLCDAPAGEEHGYIYLGDGWHELVYRHIHTCEHCGADALLDDDGEPHCTCDHDFYPLDNEEREEHMATDDNTWILPGGVIRTDRICHCSTPAPMEFLKTTCRECQGTIGAKAESRP